MIDDEATENRRRDGQRRQPPDEPEPVLAERSQFDDDARHYLHDPNGLLENARDADEREQDGRLELDQTELDELGLTLDDPHQPEP